MSHAKMAAVTFLILKAPRSVGELCRLLNMDYHSVQNMVLSLVSEGLVDLAGRQQKARGVGGLGARVYRWTGGAQ